MTELINYTRKPKVLIFIVAYNAGNTIEKVLRRIPSTIATDYLTDVLIIDDQSEDDTVERCEKARKSGSLNFKTRVLINPENQGYGGNQKIGFQYAIENNYDFVVLLHGDGQYAPESMPVLLEAIVESESETGAVFGSRMITRFGALQGGMPVYKYVGNRLLSYFQNLILQSRLSEFHSGYRVYSVAALKRIPFNLNTNDFHFDTEIIIQLLFAGHRIKECSIPTYYGDEICRVNGIKYAKNVVISTLKAKAQYLGILYEKKFDCKANMPENYNYKSKLDFDSPSKWASDEISPGSNILDIGCGPGFLLQYLVRKGCKATGIDKTELKEYDKLFQFYTCDINKEDIPVNISKYDHILMLDVLEHLHCPEEFIDKIYQMLSFSTKVKIIASTGNIAFFLLRIMLLGGQFNYGKRGILDLTHTRLFTFKTFRRLFEQANFEVLKVEGIPAPFILAIGDNFISRFLLQANKFLIRISKSLFSYQIYLVAKPKKSLDLLLKEAKKKGIENKLRSTERLFGYRNSE